MMTGAKRSALLALTLLGPLPALAADLPTIVVDEAHAGFARPDGSDPPPYSISPAPGVVVLASDYRIPVPKELGVPGPNSLHLVLGKERKYKVDWRGNGRRHELSAATLRRLPGSVPFDGFRSGDTAIVVIGFDHTGVTPGKENVLSAMWLGMIKVR